jgi:hypothetical protein
MTEYTIPQWVNDKDTPLAYNLVSGKVYPEININNADGSQVSPTKPLPVGNYYVGSAAMTVGTDYAAGRAVGVAATVAGNVKIKLADASLVIVPVAVGWTILPLSATTIVAAGTDATATYYKLV